MGNGSNPHSRAAKRDYWNSPQAAKLSHVIDWTYAIALTLAIFIAGSLNF